MQRVIRFGLLASVLALGLGFSTPANAVDTVAYTWVVDCRVPGGASTGMIEFIPGTYVVTATGVCAYASDNDKTVPATTPCTALSTDITCVGVTVDNIEGELCVQSFSAVVTQPCSPTPGVTVNGACSWFTVQVTSTAGNTCLDTVAGVVGTVTTLVKGAMSARFMDGIYPDNTGFFLVTATRI